jgi:hypothetical protein
MEQGAHSVELQIARLGCLLFEVDPAIPICQGFIKRHNRIRGRERCGTE